MKKWLALTLGLYGECLLALADFIDPFPSEQESRLRDSLLEWRPRV